MVNKLDSDDYRKFTFKSEFDKAIHTLEGFLNGIAIDNIINDQEVEEFKNWCNSNRRFIKNQPLKDLISYIIEAIEDNYLDEEEQSNIISMCRYFNNGSKYYNTVTSDIQRLHGIMRGILADNEITEKEVIQLDKWLEVNRHLVGIYPYDELSSLILSILEDHIVSEEEKDILKVFFSEFINENETSTINFDEINKLKENTPFVGIMTSDPEVSFINKKFCISGKFKDYKRSDISKMISELGGDFSSSVTKDTNYLVVGTDGNQSWAFSCYGRKVEQATELRKHGNEIQILREEDFIDAYEDNV